MPKIIDCFMFWNELEILYIRLSILYKHVDHFIICESKQSHSGKIIKDEYCFIKNKHLFTEFLDKIIFLPLPLNLVSKSGDSAINTHGVWPNENFQRKFLFCEIEKFPGDTLVAISDLDEIWDPKNIEQIKQNVHKFKVCGVIQVLFYYYLNCKRKQK